MTSSRGKVRLGVIALLSVVAFAMVGLHRFPERAYGGGMTPTVFVTDSCTNAVTAYAVASAEDISQLAPLPAGLSEPTAVAFDKNGNFYVTNKCNATDNIPGAGVGVAVGVAAVSPLLPLA